MKHFKYTQDQADKLVNIVDLVEDIHWVVPNDGDKICK